MLAQGVAQDSRGPIILMYHGVVDRVRDPDLDAWSITAEELRRHLEALTRRWEVVALDSLVQALERRRALPPRAVILTFDDAYRGLFEHGWPVLREFGVPWTVFVPAGLVGTGRTEPGIWSALCYLRSPRSEIAFEWDGMTVRQRLGTREERLALRVAAAQTPGMAEAVVRAFGEEAEELLAAYPPLQMMSWEALAELGQKRVGIGAHGWLHRRLAPGVAAEVLAEEIERPREELSRRGLDCHHFCAPYGVYFPGAVERARAAGYSAFVTSEPGRVTEETSPFALPRVRADVPWSQLEAWLVARDE